jgi:hypothetical protein
MKPATSNTVSPNIPVFQKMMIDNPTMASIKLRIKVGYLGAGGQIDETIDFAGFDASLWS